MCLTCYMLPLRQEQLTASLTTPQVPKMTQSNRIRVFLWGGGCFCVRVYVRAQMIHPWIFFFQPIYVRGEERCSSLGGLMPWQLCCCKKNKAWEGVWDRDLRGWFTAVWHNGICAQSWNHSLGSALIKPIGFKPYYSAVKCQKTSHLPCCSVSGLILKNKLAFVFLWCKNAHQLLISCVRLIIILCGNVEHLSER